MLFVANYTSVRLIPNHGVPIDIWSQKILHCLIHPLALTIGLRMKYCTKMDIYTMQVEQQFRELVGKARILIIYDHLWEPM